MIGGPRNAASQFLFDTRAALHNTTTLLLCFFVQSSQYVSVLPSPTTCQHPSPCYATRVHIHLPAGFVAAMEMEVAHCRPSFLQGCLLHAPISVQVAAARVPTQQVLPAGDGVMGVAVEQESAAPEATSGAGNAAGKAVPCRFVGHRHGGWAPARRSAPPSQRSVLWGLLC